MGTNRTVHGEVRRLVFASRLTPLLVTLWLLAAAVVVTDFASPEPWINSLGNTLSFAFVGALVLVAQRARRNVRRYNSPSPSVR